MIYIRADGNPEIGTGHIMRCLSIADAIKEQGAETTFIVADDCMEPLLSERGYGVIKLHSAWNGLEKEIGEISALIKDRGVKQLIIDSYYVTQRYLAALRGLTYIAYIDDLNAFHYPCDMLINYSCYADKFDYPANYPNTDLLLGCSYAPLRREFQSLPRRIPNERVKSALITTGGIDPYNAASKIVREIKTSQCLKQLELHIVAGRFSPHMDGLRILAREYDGAAVHSDVKNISQMMLDCDIAVSAGGSTLYELCACGTPAVAFCFADNQRETVNGFGGGYMINAGDFRENEELCLGRISQGIFKLVSDYELRLGMSGKMQELIDGNGALRIADSILKYDRAAL